MKILLLRSSSLNGKKSIEEYWHLKERKLNRKYKLNLALSLIITNAFVYMISIGSPQQGPMEVSLWHNFKNSENKKVIIKTENYIDPQISITSSPITILDQSNKVIIKKAWLHNSKKSDNFDSNIYVSRIEVQEKDINKFTITKSSIFKLFPFSKQIFKKKKNIKENYEIIF